MPTTDNTFTLITGMQFTNVGAGDYLLNFGGWLSHSTNNADITTEIYVNNVAVVGSSMLWKRGAGQGVVEGVHTYSNFPITVGAGQTVEMRWSTSSNNTNGTITNRYITLIKI